MFNSTIEVNFPKLRENTHIGARKTPTRQDQNKKHFIAYYSQKLNIQNIEKILKAARDKTQGKPIRTNTEFSMETPKVKKVF